MFIMFQKSLYLKVGICCATTWLLNTVHLFDTLSLANGHYLIFLKRNFKKKLLNKKNIKKRKKKVGYGRCWIKAVVE